MGKAQEYKSFPVMETKIIDADQGIVEHIVAVMGNIDRGDDVIHPGAFSKSIMERGLKVKVLDQHDTRSVESVIGKPLELREVGRLELPPSLTDQYPDATGALVAKTQFLLDTNRGREAFSRIKAGAVDEYSIGYDPITSDYSTVDKDGKKKTIRNLREVRIWEYSPVVFGMNPATATLSAKEHGGGEDKDAEPSEAKPYRVYEEGGQFCVYKLNMDGEPTGESLGCHGSAEEAQAQVAALYANEAGAEPAEEEKGEDEEKAVWTARYVNDLPDSSFLYIESGMDKDEDGKTTPRSARHFPYRDGEGNVDLPHLRNAIARIPQSNAPGLDDARKGQLQERARSILDREQGKALEVIVDGVWYVPEFGDQSRLLPGDDKAGRVLAARNARRLEAALATITEVLKDAGLIQDVAEDEEAEEKEEGHEAPAEARAAEDMAEAGPVIPPTSERLATLRKLQMELLEVEK